MTLRLTATVQTYSSVVGGGVSLSLPDGQIIGEIIFLNRTSAMQDKTLQLRLSDIIAAAINAEDNHG